MLNKLIAQTVIPLYEEKIPNSKSVIDEEISEYGADSILRISKITRPTLTVYLAPDEKATGIAVIICPGGGYSLFPLVTKALMLLNALTKWV